MKQLLHLEQPLHEYLGFPTLWSHHHCRDPQDRTPRTLLSFRGPRFQVSPKGWEDIHTHDPASKRILSASQVPISCTSFPFPALLFNPLLTNKSMLGVSTSMAVEPRGYHLEIPTLSGSPLGCEWHPCIQGRVSLPFSFLFGNRKMYPEGVVDRGPLSSHL